jgi:hypothetical protein
LFFGSELSDAGSALSVQAVTAGSSALRRHLPIWMISGMSLPAGTLSSLKWPASSEVERERSVRRVDGAGDAGRRAALCGAVDDQALETGARLTAHGRVEAAAGAVGTRAVTARCNEANESEEEGPAHGAVL